MSQRISKTAGRRVLSSPKYFQPYWDIWSALYRVFTWVEIIKLRYLDYVSERVADVCVNHVLYEG
jgi:hypothetical protein